MDEQGDRGTIAIAQERSINAVAQEAQVALRKIRIDVEGKRNEDWKGPLDIANDNLNFVAGIVKGNSPVREFLLRTRREVVFCTVRESEGDNIVVLLRSLRLQPDRRAGMRLSVSESIGKANQISPSIISYPFDSSAEVEDHRGDLRKAWTTNYWAKRSIQEFVKLQPKDLVDRLLKAVKVK